MREKVVPQRIRPIDFYLRSQAKNSFLAVLGGTYFDKLPNEILSKIWLEKTEMESATKFKKVLKQMRYLRRFNLKFNFVRRHFMKHMFSLLEFEEFDIPYIIHCIMRNQVTFDVLSIEFATGVISYRACFPAPFAAMGLRTWAVSYQVKDRLALFGGHPDWI
jgi:hypothetical protein